MDDDKKGWVVDGGEATPPADDESDQHPLQRRWMVWRHGPCYDGGSYADTRALVTPRSIGTIESFWRHHNNLPAPSALFGSHRERLRAGSGSTLEGISMFEEGVLPDWEHVRNAHGASVVFKGSFGPRHADVVWQRALMALVGEHAEGSDHINGVRLIDRVSSMRIEVWLDDDAEALTARVGRWFSDHVFAGAVPPTAVHEPFVTAHAQAKTVKGEGYRATPRARRPPLGGGGQRRAPASAPGQREVRWSDAGGGHAFESRRQDRDSDEWNDAHGRW